MRIDAAEADVIAAHLRAHPSDLPAWITRLEDSVRRFGLGRPEAGDGRRALARRRYTCPFYLEPGCALPFEVKPLGCLAFNPRGGGLTDGGNCGTAGVASPLSPSELRPIPLAVLAALPQPIESIAIKRLDSGRK